MKLPPDALPRAILVARSRRSSRPLFACAVFWCVGTILAAQTQSTSANGKKDDEVVALSPFIVSTSTDDASYDAANSTTASRVAEKNQNLPYNVNVVTAEFLKDLRVTDDFNEAFAFTSSFGGNDSTTYGGYTLRGVAATTIVDGFTASGLFDFANVSRAEVIKGPAASIYGQTSPGGILNVITSRPSARRRQSVDFMMGNYDQRRVSLTSTGPIGGQGSKTLYHIFASSQERSYEQNFNSRTIKSVYASLSHKFSSDTSLLARFDYIDRRDEGVRSTILTEVSPTNTALRMRFADELFNFNYNGPQSWFHRTQAQALLQFEHRFNQAVSLRLGGLAYDRVNHDLGILADRYNPATRLVILREPQYRSQRIKGHSLQADLFATYHLRSVAMRTLLTFDYLNSTNPFQTYRLPSSLSSNAAYNIRNLSVDNPDWFIRPYEPSVYSNVTANRVQNNLIKGIFLRQQFGLLSNRLLVLAAARQDWVDLEFNDYRSNSIQRGKPKDLTTQFGVNYKLTPGLMLYASRAESFVPQTGGTGQLVGADEDGNPLANETGVGYEVGMKPEFFDGKFTMTLAWYDITRNNVRVTELVDLPNGTTITRTRATGQYRSTGVELDGNWKPTDQLQFIGGLGVADPRVTDNGNDLDAIGRPAPRVPKYSGGLLVRFKPFTDGRAKGLSLRAGVSYTSETFPFTTQSSTDANGNGYIDAGEGDSRRSFRIPGYTLWQLGASYSFSRQILGKKSTHSLQLNVKNLFDRRYLNNSAYAGDGRNISGSYSLSF